MVIVMPYCVPGDLLLGDLELPAGADLYTYIDRAGVDVDLYLGQRYSTPILTGTAQTNGILKAVTADLAAAYVIMAQAQGGEDNRVNAYAMHLYQRAMARLQPYMEGEALLLPGAQLIPQNAGDAGGPVTLVQKDKVSPVDAFYDYVQHPPLFPGSPVYYRPFV